MGVQRGDMEGPRGTETVKADFLKEVTLAPSQNRY